MPDIDQIRERFSSDSFATQAAGAIIDRVEPGHAICFMELRPVHLNANSAPMGGAIFTLADFAFAVAANAYSGRVTVTQQVSVNFLSAAKGKKLIAEARCMKQGHSSCFYTVEVRDELDIQVAYFTVNGHSLYPAAESR